jgi:transposase
MEDNAQPHVARQVIDYLNAVDIPFMEWPPNSPDLNPIGHLWDAFKKKVRSRTLPPFNDNQLVDAVINEWENTPQEITAHLINA